ncbi:MAG: hypothetical protein WAW80_02325 [Candidatus Saccharimonadales bacterium]
MENTYKTSVQTNAYYETPLDRLKGNEHLTRCDKAGEKDPAVEIFINPKGGFDISEPYKYGTREQKALSHIIGAFLVEYLPVEIDYHSLDESANRDTDERLIA